MSECKICKDIVLNPLGKSLMITQRNSWTGKEKTIAAENYCPQCGRKLYQEIQHYPSKPDLYITKRDKGYSENTGFKLLFKIKFPRAPFDFEKENFYKDLKESLHWFDEGVKKCLMYFWNKKIITDEDIKIFLKQEK